MDQEKSPRKKAEEAQALYRSGDYAAAVDAFHAASRAYDEMGDRRNAAEMRSNQSVAHLQLDEYQRALEAIQGVDQIFAGAGDSRRHAVALSNQAAALEGVGRREEAVEVYWKAADLFERIGGREKREQVMRALSALQLKSRQPMGAMASMLAGLEKVEDPSIFQRMLKKVLEIPFRLMDH